MEPSSSSLPPTTYNLQPILLFLILALGAFLRFYDIKETPLGLYPDEAMNGNNALETLHTGNWKIFYPENNGREGLFINIQALSVAAFGNVPWALRIVSAFFGTLTILGIYLVTKELFRKKNQESRVRNQEKEIKDSPIHNSKFMIHDSSIIALLSSFFIATSYWHLNFSRIGFRAIMVPFFCSFGLYFLLRGLRTARQVNLVYQTKFSKLSLGATGNLILAGIFIGLGFHTYIAFRFMPFVLAAPILWYLWKWRRNANIRTHANNANDTNNARAKPPASCMPCAIALLLFIAFVVALPIGYYFLTHSQDFLGRSGQVSVFSAESPIKEFALSNLKTIGMFFYRGDCNWRHNYACQAELHPLVAGFFLIGIFSLFTDIYRRTRVPNYEARITKYDKEGENRNSGFVIRNSSVLTLIAWLIFMSLPATLTREGLPHALRSIGMIPPVMILAGFGAYSFASFVIVLLERAKAKAPELIGKITRIQREFLFLFIVAFLFVPLATYERYFQNWAQKPETYYAFATDFLHIGQYLNTLPTETKKIVVVNASGTDVRGIPMPAQTVMFITDTFLDKQQKEKNTLYLTANNIEDKSRYRDVSSIDPGQKMVIVFMNGQDRPLIQAYQKKFPELHAKAPGDFVVLEAN
ncbi:MAG: hypothetical protein G01um101433_620 [Parcubacteria group bacterium Gr01-1014_33]|nr:MAG: hypothetical protein G01um101433_620 [Parcubacteria group bacterium Gr01-1014_33]